MIGRNVIHFKHSGVIAAPVRAVFGLLSDPARIPQWRKDVARVSEIVKPVEKGSTFIEEVSFLGTRQLLMEVAECHPFDKLVLAGRQGMPMLPTQSFTLFPHEQGCELSLEVEMRLLGGWRLLSPILPGMLLKKWRAYFGDLEALLKSSPSA